jgi:hypothetical protein
MCHACRARAVVCTWFVLQGCAASSLEQYASSIPDVSDWTDCGTVLDPGRPGDWDLYLWGGFAASIVKRAGTYLLYYQGSDGYDDVDGTVTNRAIGLATSPDGIHFTKHAQNPVLRFDQTGNHEEGAVSSAVFVDELSVLMYYGANTWTGSDQVSADARLATSEDGVHFTDRGVILDHADRRVWGSGDEIFPVIGFRFGERQMIYYIPNGTPERAQLGVAWADGNGVFRSSSVTSMGLAVSAWGAGSAIRVGPHAYALFVSDGRDRPYMEVRLVSPAEPGRVSVPVHRYQWTDARPVTVIKDEDRNIWSLYYRNGQGGYGLMRAAMHSGASPGSGGELCGA